MLMSWMKRLYGAGSGYDDDFRSNYTITCYPRVQTIYCIRVTLAAICRQNFPCPFVQYNLTLQGKYSFYYSISFILNITEVLRLPYNSLQQRIFHGT